MEEYEEQIKRTAQFLRGKYNYAEPTLGIILGTGLGPLAGEIAADAVIPYSEIPGFPVSTVEGHEGALIFGALGGKKVVAMKGRFHYYEGYTMKEVTFPVRVMRELGVRTLIVSNAAGGTNPRFRVGDVMIITDHINGFPDNPLRGKNVGYGPRFLDMHEPYDRELLDKAKRTAEELGIKVVDGVYYGTQGPTYETPAEYRAFAALGADAVGMSTVPEVIVARHAGLKVFGVSVITDIGVTADGSAPKEVSHEEVQREGEKATKNVMKLVAALVERI